MDIKIEEEVGGRESLPFSPVAGADRSFLTDSEDLSVLVAPKEEAKAKDSSQLSSQQPPSSSHPDPDNFPSFPSSRAHGSPEIDLNVAQGWLEDLDNLDIGPPSSPPAAPVRDSARAQVSERVDEDSALARDMEDFFNAPDVSVDGGSYGDTDSNVDNSQSSYRLSIVKGGVDIERESLGYKIPQLDIKGPAPPNKLEIQPRPSDRGPKGQPLSVDPGFPQVSERGAVSLREPRLPSREPDFSKKPVAEFVPPLSFPKTSPQAQQNGEMSFKPTKPSVPPAQEKEVPKSLRLGELGQKPAQVEGRTSNYFFEGSREPDEKDLPPSVKQPSISASLQAAKKDPPAEIKLRPLVIASEDSNPTSQTGVALKPEVRTSIPVISSPKPAKESSSSLWPEMPIGEKEEFKTSLRPPAFQQPASAKPKEEQKASPVAKQPAGFLGNLIEEAAAPVKSRPGPSQQLPTLEIQESDSLLAKAKSPEEKKAIPPLPSAFAMGKSLQGKEPQRVKFDAPPVAEAPPIDRKEDKLPPLHIASILDDEQESGDYDPIPAQGRDSKPPVSVLKFPNKPQGQPEAQIVIPNPRGMMRDTRPQSNSEEEGKRPLEDEEGRRNEPPILTYHQCYDRIVNSDIAKYRSEYAAPRRSCLKAMLSCCVSTHEILVPEIKAAMSFLLAFEKRPMDLSNPLDQSILMSIWSRCIETAPFAVQHEAWKAVIGFAGPQPLANDTVGTLGVLQLLFCLSEGRDDVVDRTLEESRKPGKGFPLAETSLEITRLAMRVVKSGDMNEQFEKLHNVRDVFNCFCLGCFQGWINQNSVAPGRVDFAAFEKVVKRNPMEFVSLGKKSSS